jgi:hypothetical protein
LAGLTQGRWSSSFFEKWLTFFQDEIYGNTRTATFLISSFSIAVILFTWLVPSEKKDANMLLATTFVFKLNLYFLLPLISILRNEQIVKFVRQRTKMSENVNPPVWLRSNTVSPA